MVAVYRKLFYSLIASFALIGNFHSAESTASSPVQARCVHKFLNSGNYEGLSARVIRGPSPEYFKSLNFDSDRRLAFLVGPDAFDTFKKSSGYEMLMAIGYPEDYIEYIVNQKNIFKLVVFPEHIQPKLATWENVLELTAKAYPEIRNDLMAHQKALKTLEFEEFERMAGFKFRHVEKCGYDDERFMTYERYLKSQRSLLETRAFLYFTVRLNDLYSGDGYTYDYEGNRCLKEYITLNTKLAELDDYLLFDIEVQLPTPLVHVN